MPPAQDDSQLCSRGGERQRGGAIRVPALPLLPVLPRSE